MKVIFNNQIYVQIKDINFLNRLGFDKLASKKIHLQCKLLSNEDYVLIDNFIYRNLIANSYFILDSSYDQKTEEEILSIINKKLATGINSKTDEHFINELEETLKRIRHDQEIVDDTKRKEKLPLR